MNLKNQLVFIQEDSKTVKIIVNNKVTNASHFVNFLNNIGYQSEIKLIFNDITIIETNYNPYYKDFSEDDMVIIAREYLAHLDNEIPKNPIDYKENLIS